MNTSSNNGLPSNANRRDSSITGEDTLRLIAHLPAPDGLAGRVKAGLVSAPETGRILMWSGPPRPAGGWMYSTIARGAAAAAIVGIVAGGGWRIYSHVQPAPSANVIVTPAPSAPQGSGFSNAGAKRVPETLQGPVLKHPVTPMPEVNVVEKLPAHSKASKKKHAAAGTAPHQ
jgi:hypothetical protein